jgi:chromate reductase
MTSYNVGYFVGSLSTASINRLLSKALIRLAPPELQMTEIPYKDLPLYNRDHDADYPLVAREFKNSIAAVDAACSSRRSTTVRYPEP